MSGGFAPGVQEVKTRMHADEVALLRRLYPGVPMSELLRRAINRYVAVTALVGSRAREAEEREIRYLAGRLRMLAEMAAGKREPRRRWKLRKVPIVSVVKRK